MSVSAEIEDLGPPPNEERLRREVACLRNALEKIQKLTDQFDEGDAYEDIDALQEFENRVSDIVEIALAKSV